MTDYPLIFSLWAMASTILALIWYIWQLNQTFSVEREAMREERENMREAADSERRELYDRIQAGTLENFKLHEEAEQNETDQEEDEIVDLDEAKEDLMSSV